MLAKCKFQFVSNLKKDNKYSIFFLQNKDFMAVIGNKNQFIVSHYELMEFIKKAIRNVFSN